MNDGELHASATSYPPTKTPPPGDFCVFKVGIVGWSKMLGFHERFQPWVCMLIAWLLGNWEVSRADVADGAAGRLWKGEMVMFLGSSAVGAGNLWEDTASWWVVWYILLLAL